MVVNVKLNVSGIQVEDVNSLKVFKTTSDFSSSSTFRAVINNYSGRHQDTYTVGDEIDVFTDLNTTPPTTKIFTGILEDINFEGIEAEEIVILKGKDFIARLQDRNVEPEVYNNLTAGSIVNDIINKYTDDITTNNVNGSETVISRLAFNQTQVFDAIKQLAELSNNVFYIDNNKDLHFEPKSTISSNLIFGSGNVLRSTFEEKRNTLYNEIWVYGDRYLDDFSETFTAGSPLGGSVFTLVHQPHNTEILVNSNSQKGSIEGISLIPPSGADYAVSFFDRKIIFVSGTTLGYSSIPESGATVDIKYDRSLPIVKVSRDISSIETYGTRVKAIIDKNIKDPVTATDIAKNKLLELSIPKKQGILNIKGVIDVIPSQTAVVNLPWEGVNNKTYDIIEARYNFTKRTNLNEEVLSVSVNKRIEDSSDKIKELDSRLRKIEASDISNADILTRLELENGSVSIRQSGLFIRTSTITGSGFHLYGTGFIPPSGPFHLASGTLQAGLAGSFTGSGPIFNPFVTIFSGGFF